MPPGTGTASIGCAVIWMNCRQAPHAVATAGGRTGKRTVRKTSAWPKSRAENRDDGENQATDSQTRAAGGRGALVARAALAIAIVGGGAYWYLGAPGLGENAAPENMAAKLPPAQTLRDCDECPEMVVVPVGTFQMGSNNADSDEKPVHQVSIRSFAVGRYEVTFEQWDACVAAGGCSHKPEDRNWGRGKRPVIHVNWYDVQEYVKWLSRRTGKSYRLLSEAEWEYAALGGARSQVFGKGNANANCDGCGSRWDNKQTAPVGSFQPNGFGLHDTLGNVWEWTQDCWKWGYLDAPADGSAGTSGNCFRRVLRGGSWFVRPRDLRSANRDRLGTTIRGEDVGFRVSRTHP